MKQRYEYSVRTIYDASSISDYDITSSAADGYRLVHIVKFDNSYGDSKVAGLQLIYEREVEEE